MRLIVPYVEKKFKNSCTECCAEMVLKYYGINNIDQFKIHELGYWTFETLNGLFESQGFIVNYNTGYNIDELKNYLDNRIPIIIRIYNSHNHKNLHTILLIGYYDGHLYYHDNELGSNKIMSFNNFMNDWTYKYIIVLNNNRNIIHKEKHNK